MNIIKLSVPDSRTARLAPPRLLYAFGWLSLTIEQIVILIWPQLLALLLYFTLALWGVWHTISGWLHVTAMAAWLAAIIIMTIWRARQFRWPRAGQLTARLESASALHNQPLQSLKDQAAQPDPLSHLLWHHHQLQLARSLWKLRLAWPQPQLARRDPWALRWLLALLFALGLLVAGDSATMRLSLAVWPSVTREAIDAIKPPLFHVWLTPPAYTQLPPIYIANDNPGNRAPDVLTIPNGTEILVRVSGGLFKPRLLINGQLRKLQRADDNFYELTDHITMGDQIVLRQGFSTLADLKIKRVADQLPRAAWLIEPHANARNEVEMQYQLNDAYALKAMTLRLWSADSDPAAAQIITLAAPAGAKNITQTIRLDLTANPLAGLTANLQLAVVNSADKTGLSLPVTIVLPDRDFHNVNARALIAARKKIIRHADDAPSSMVATINTLRQSLPKDKNNLALFLALGNLEQQLVLLQAHNDDTLRSAIIKTAWQIAVRLEDGAAADLKQNLRNAEAALRQGLQDKTITESELTRRLQNYRNALADYLHSPAAVLGTAPSPGGPITRRMTERDLAQKLDELEAALAGGARQDAARLLQDIADALANVQAADGDNHSPRDPFGRMIGSDGGRDVTLDHDILSRAREILEELRNRANDPNRPADEKDYLQRLLDIF